MLQSSSQRTTKKGRNAPQESSSRGRNGEAHFSKELEFESRFEAGLTARAPPPNKDERAADKPNTERGRFGSGRDSSDVPEGVADDKFIGLVEGVSAVGISVSSLEPKIIN